MVFRGQAFRNGCDAEGLASQLADYRSIDEMLVLPLEMQNGTVDVHVTVSTPCGNASYTGAIKSHHGSRLKSYMEVPAESSQYQGASMKAAVDHLISQDLDGSVYDFVLFVRHDLKLLKTLDCALSRAPTVRLGNMCEEPYGVEGLAVSDILHIVPRQYLTGFQAAIGHCPTVGAKRLATYSKACPACSKTYADTASDGNTSLVPYPEQYADCAPCVDFVRGCFIGGGSCGSSVDGSHTKTADNGHGCANALEDTLGQAVRADIEYCWPQMRDGVRESNPNYLLDSPDHRMVNASTNATTISL